MQIIAVQKKKKKKHGKEKSTIKRNAFESVLMR